MQALSTPAGHAPPGTVKRSTCANRLVSGRFNTSIATHQISSTYSTAHLLQPWRRQSGTDSDRPAFANPSSTGKHDPTKHIK